MIARRVRVRLQGIVMNRRIGVTATMLLSCLLCMPPTDGAQTAPDAIEPPPAPQITAPLQGSTIPQPGVAVAGTAQANSGVTVILDSVVVGGTPADGAGNWQLGLYLADGQHQVKAYATNAAGSGADSAVITFLVADRIFASDFEIVGLIFADDFEAP